MAIRDLIGVGLVGLAGYMVYNMLRGNGVINVRAPISIGSTVGKVAMDVGDYLSRLASVESSNQPYVKAKTSSASGLYQFTKGTWESLGGKWGSDLSKAFGGLFPTIEEQNAKIAQLTNQSANALAAAGIPISNGTLYAAHFLGVGTAIKVLSAPAGTLVASLVAPGVITANPFLKGMTVAGFYQWLQGKVGA